MRLRKKPSSGDIKSAAHEDKMHEKRHELTHAQPTHQAAYPSLFSSHSPLDYRGFHNLVMLLLFVANLRLIVENYMKYGLLLEVGKVAGSIMADMSGLVVTLQLCLGLVPLSWLMCWAAEYQLSQLATSSSKARSIISWPLMALNVLNLIAMVVGCNVAAYYYIDHPMLASLPCFASLISLLKLISYVAVNAELRHLYLTRPNDPLNSVYGEEVAYPRNLSLGNMGYFALAPTLCYQPTYPMTERFRKFFFGRRLLEVLTLSVAMYFLAEQYSRPILKNSLTPFKELNALALFERVLKLSIPSIYIWLLMFYLVFHSYLNMWAEIMRFSDRSFYRPWWNATTIAEYWRLWNLPVYRWFKRHVYSPLLARGYPKWIAGIVAFFISAIGHEIIVGIPVKVLEGWAFWAMMGQVPLIWLTEIIKWVEEGGLKRAVEEKKSKLKRAVSSGNVIDSTDVLQPDTTLITSTSLSPESSQPPESLSLGKPKEEEREREGRSRKGILGNYVFWISFCIVGQPLGVLLYYRSWYLREHPELFQ